MQIIGAMVIVLSIAAGLQTPGGPSSKPPDFSGTWKLNRNLSSSRPSLSLIKDLTLVISHGDSKLNVTRILKSGKKDDIKELTYYTDNRGEKNPLLFGGTKRESKTFWSGNKLVSRYTAYTLSNGVNHAQEAVDIWELSKDGQTLTITSELGEAHNLNRIERYDIKPGTYQKVFQKAQ